MAFELMAIDHVQLAMPAGGEPAARAFYVALLGLVEAEKPAILAARGGCWFRSPSIELHLGVEEDFRPAKKAHPALRVRGLDELVGSLQAAGFAFRPDDAIEGCTRGYVDDPFGNRIELIDA